MGFLNLNKIHCPLRDKMYKCVIAKYKEDLLWTKDLPCEVIVLNKDPDDSSWDINYNNIGRESESYTRYIIDNYENLNPEDIIVFLQGNPFDHLDMEELLSVLPYNGSPIKSSHLPIPLCNRWTYIHQANNFICYKNGIYNNFLTPSDPMMSWNLTVYFAEYLNLPKFEYIISHTGAQWVVPVKYILNKSKQWWQNTLSVHYLEDKDLSLVAGYCMERLFETIWYHSDLEKQYVKKSIL